MASKELPVPAPMLVKGDIKGNWNFFKAQWSNYEIATELIKKDAPIRIATFLTVMGKDCFQIYENLPLSEDDGKDIHKILESLDQHFMPKTNVIYECYVFNTADQLSSELFDDYLCRLRELAKSCEFGAFADELIRDRIVLGAKDQGVRERLLRESKLTLDSVIGMCRTSERTSNQRNKLQGPSETGSTAAPRVNFASKGSKNAKTRNSQKTRASKSSGESTLNFKCKYCGGKHAKGRKKLLC